MGLGAAVDRVFEPIQSTGTVQVIDKDCKRMSVDSKTGDVWIAFSNAQGSFAQRLKPTR